MSKKRKVAEHAVPQSSQGMGFFQLVALMIVAAGLVLGLFWLFESIGQNSNLVKALTKILGSIVTVFTTYFLINRSLRLRERQSDTVVASFAGYIDYLSRLYGGLYEGGPEDDEKATELLSAVNRFEEYEDFYAYAERMRINANNLPAFLLDSLCFPSYMQTAKERLEDIYDATRQMTTLLGVSTPKLAIDAIQIVDEYSVLYRDDLPVINRGLRAYQKLQTIAQYTHAAQYEQYMQQDIADSLAAIMEAIRYVFIKVPRSLEEHLRKPLNNFRANLHSRYHEAYDNEVAAAAEDAEILDID